MREKNTRRQKDVSRLLREKKDLHRERISCLNKKIRRGYR